VVPLVVAWAATGVSVRSTPATAAVIAMPSVEIPFTVFLSVLVISS
jgi:hypothetical protein